MLSRNGCYKVLEGKSNVSGFSEQESNFLIINIKREKFNQDKKSHCQEPDCASFMIPLNEYLL